MKVPNLILHELRGHAPFTAIGALSGIVLMLIVVLAAAPAHITNTAFYICHPVHVMLSAIVTSAMFWRYRRNLAMAIVLGYVGSIVLGTLSDVLLPHVGGWLMGLEMDHVEQHIGFIEEWWAVNPAALLGIAIGILRSRTKVPHFGHVLVSTWASLFYLMTHGHVGNWLPVLPAAFVVLFFAVWLPCCVSDIVFPLVFVRGEGRGAAHP